MRHIVRCFALVGFFVIFFPIQQCKAEEKQSSVLVRFTVTDPTISSNPEPYPNPTPPPTDPGNRRSAASSSSSAQSLTSSRYSASNISSTASSTSSSERFFPSAPKPEDPPPAPLPPRTFIQEGPSRPILCIGTDAVCIASVPTEPALCEVPEVQCMDESFLCVAEKIIGKVTLCSIDTLHSAALTSHATVQGTKKIEITIWILWFSLVLFLLLRGERFLYRTFVGADVPSVLSTQLVLETIEHRSFISFRHILYSLCVALMVLAILVSIFTYYEGTRAENMNVEVTIAPQDFAFGCTGPIDLGTVVGSGDSGSQSDSHSAVCTVFTTNEGGYQLQWRATPHSSGVSTGSLLASSGETIPPIPSEIPALWTLGSTDVGFGARLSSDSTTVDTATWGIDGTNEKWAKISTGASVMIANRTTATSIGGDIEKIGFRASIGSSETRGAGVYSMSIIFTAITP